MEDAPNFARRRKRGFFFFMMGLFALGLAGAVIMLLWNAILPEVAGWKPLTFWQALGLFVLCRLLFGGFRFGGRPRFGDKRRFSRLSDAERAEIRARWEARCRKENSGD